MGRLRLQLTNLDHITKGANLKVNFQSYIWIDLNQASAAYSNINSYTKATNINQSSILATGGQPGHLLNSQDSRKVLDNNGIFEPQNIQS